MMHTVTIAYAAGQSVITEFAQSLAILASYQSEKYRLNQILNATGTLIDYGRNQLVSRFLHYTNSDWVMMLDSDVAFEYDIIDKLLEMAEATESKICSGWYNIRINGVPMPIIHRFLEDNVSEIHAVSENDPMYFKADGVGAGALLVHRDVFKALQGTYGPYFFKFVHVAEITVTEDFWFCRNAKSLGFDIYVHRDVHLPHYKTQAL